MKTTIRLNAIYIFAFAYLITFTISTGSTSTFTTTGRNACYGDCSTQVKPTSEGSFPESTSSCVSSGSQEGSATSTGLNYSGSKSTYTETTSTGYGEDCSTFT
eukprot:GAHX01000099.1.p1 GENE.GAHX01000099.1~~GAHX01000099.1.p1  ORF type:complete len:103 (-),score=8.05 GAHX01000099.1:227-535(-)